MMPLQILIADDHEIVRRGLRSLIEYHPGWEVCGEAATGLEAIKLAISLRPQIVIMDMGMPERNGLEATREIKRQLPKTEMLIFTGSENEGVVREVFRAGAKAYLLKGDVSTQLIPALEALALGHTYFSSKVSEIVFAGYLKENEGPDDPTISPRERETLQLIAEGRSNKEAASQLGISLKTVETHRAAIMRKLKLGSTADLVRYAVRNGIIEA